MSSFLCFVCHSTVNVDTNEDTRDKYREVIGMNLCPDSHLCFICCHFLNKMCLFKSICLKRTLEYPVLFSEKGTINLQRSDIQVAILCPEDICLQHLNTKYHFYNNEDNSQSDFDDNNYVQLQDDRNFEVNDSLHKNEFNDEFHNDDYVFSTKDNIDIFNCEELVLSNIEAVRISENEMKKDMFRDHRLLECKNELRNLSQNVLLNEWPKDTINLKPIDHGKAIEAWSRKNIISETNTISNWPKEVPIEFNPINDNVRAENITNTHNLNDKDFDKASEWPERDMEIELSTQQNKTNAWFDKDMTINEVATNENACQFSKNVITNVNPIDGVTIIPNDSHNDFSQTNEDHNEITAAENDTNSEYSIDASDLEMVTSDTQVENEEIIEKVNKNYFEKVKLSLKEQKAELDSARRDEKYLNAEFKCYSCAMSFLFKDTYQAHMMRHEESNGEYRCTICTLRFANPAVLRSHTANHAERYKCTECSSIVRARQRQTHHRQCGGKQDKRCVTCDLCFREFQSAAHLQQHLKRRHGMKSSRNILCNICGGSFKNQAAVRTHMITHINKKFTCDLCPSTFSSPYTLQQHKKKHNSADSELHYCTVCKVGYTSRKSLLAHKRNALVHKESVYKCAICDRTCPTLHSLESHTASVHVRPKHLNCNICSAKYSTRKALVRHMSCHKNVTQKQTPLCHACGESFKSTSILKRHLKTVCEKDKIEELTYYEQ